jgi:predicted transcriptional regulator
MAVSFTQSVRIKNDVLITALEQESVILNLESECYFGLDKMGTQILAALTKAKSIEDAVDTLVEEYDVDETTLRHDLTSFIEQLVAQGLIEVSDGNPV